MGKIAKNNTRTPPFALPRLAARSSAHAPNEIDKKRPHSSKPRSVLFLSMSFFFVARRPIPRLITFRMRTSSTFVAYSSPFAVGYAKAPPHVVKNDKLETKIMRERDFS